MWKRGWLFGLAVVAGLIVAACSGGGVSEDRVAALEAEIVEARSELDGVTTELDGVTTELEALRSGLAASQADLERRFDSAPEIPDDLEIRSLKVLRQDGTVAVEISEGRIRLLNTDGESVVSLSDSSAGSFIGVSRPDGIGASLFAQESGAALTLHVGTQELLNVRAEPDGSSITTRTEGEPRLTISTSEDSGLMSLKDPSGWTRVFLGHLGGDQFLQFQHLDGSFARDLR